VILLAALAIVAGAAPPVHAHAFLDHAVPAVGSTVSTAPAAIELDFTEGVEAAFSTVELTSAAGAKVETKALEHPETNVLRLPIPGLAPGEYAVRWKVVSVDTHPSEGSFRFRFAPP
jgi:hypothetical protein